VSKCTTVPVAVCGRDVDGAFELVVGGELRHRVLVLDARSRVAGVCVPYAYQDDETPGRFGGMCRSTRGFLWARKDSNLRPPPCHGAIGSRY